MPDPVRWGPDNPHPLSRMRTELVWDGKYDEYGRRRTVDVAGAAMPMQKIETVDRSPVSKALAGGQTTLGELQTTVREDLGTCWSGGTAVRSAIAAHNPCSLVNIYAKIF